MAKLVELNLNPDLKTLRQFGVIAFIGFGLLAVLAYYEKLIFAFGLGDARLTVVGVFVAIGTLALFLSLVFPKANRFLYVGLTLLAFPIGFVLSYVIMGTLFFLVITPVGLVMRLLGKNPLEVGFDSAAGSYWRDSRRRRPAESYFKQF